MGGSASTQNKKVVVILGGGYGGVAAARSLDSSGLFFTVLVDRKDYFLHNVGSLRASIDSDYAKEVAIPYSKLLQNGLHVQADVEEVSANEVRLFGHPTPLRFDYLIIATGSSYAFPGKVAERNVADAMAKYSLFNQRVRRADVRNIVIAGGGAVGVELAGELAETLGKQVKITIVNSGPRLVHNEPLKDEFMTGVERQLTRLGVEVKLGVRVVAPEAQTAEDIAIGGVGSIYSGFHSVALSDGHQLPCDLLLMTPGAATNTRSLVAHFSHVLDNGRLRVDPQQRVDGFETIFAIGDIAHGAQKRAMFASQQGEIAAKNITVLTKAINAGKDVSRVKLQAFQLPAGFPLILTIGRQGGMSQFFNAGESVFGSRVTRMLKSETLFTSKSWADLRQKAVYSKLHEKKLAALQSEELRVNPDAKDTPSKVAELTKILGVTEQQAKQVLQKGFHSAPIQAGQDHI